MRTPAIRVDTTDHDLWREGIGVEPHADGRLRAAYAVFDRAEKAAVDETVDEVAVALRRSEARPSDQNLVCTQVIQEKSVDVRLHAPLGDRQVVDASTGKAVPVGG
ncbi:MAG TPA: hypothetical protein VIL34_06700 [Actinopolymorphaceae bacterium]